MPFTGKCTYSAGSSLPEIAEDVSDIVSLVSPVETPLLDLIGDGREPAQSTLHEWVEDALFPNADQINDSTYGNALTDTTFGVDHAAYFRVGDQIQVEDSAEVMFVTALDTGANTLTVVRGYGGSTAEALADDKKIIILGNASLEGDDAAGARYKSRSRKSNYTQIFTETIEVSGSETAVKHIGIDDEYDAQSQRRISEMIRNLENTVINSYAPSATQEGSATVRRTMKGIRQLLVTNRWLCGTTAGFAAGVLSMTMLHNAQRLIYEQCAVIPNVFVIPPAQATGLALAFDAASRKWADESAIRDQIVQIVTEFGPANLVISRHVPRKCALALYTPLISLIPLQGRTFTRSELAKTGDSRRGQIVGEYTLELRNENAHGIISNLSLPT